MPEAEDSVSALSKGWLYEKSDPFTSVCYLKGESCYARTDLRVTLVQHALPTRKVNIRLPGEGNSNSHGARPIHQIILMIKWIRTSRLAIKNSLPECCYARMEFPVRHWCSMLSPGAIPARGERESSLLTTYWSEPTLSS